MDELTPQEQAAMDQAFAAARVATIAAQDLALAALGAAKRMNELADCLLEQEQREFIGIVANY